MNPALPVVLIVSPNAAKISSLRQILKEDAIVVEQPTAKEGIEYAKNATLQAIIVDEKISDIPLVEFCSSIRHFYSSIETPILIITSVLQKNFLLQLKKAGATHFLREPLEKREVLNELALSFKVKEKNQNIKKLSSRLKDSPQSKPTLMAQRKILTSQAIQEIAKARKTADFLTLLLIELDPCLRKAEAAILLALSLQKNLRPQDLLIPQSPGKFVVILPKTSEKAAQFIAETLREEATQIPFSSPLSISIGLISLNKDTPPFGGPLQDFQHLLAYGSKAVTEAKKTGNKIISLPLEEKC